MSGSTRSQSWRWMILFSRFLWSFICVGSLKALGVFVPHFIQSFSTTTAAAGLACSASLGPGMVIAGPFVGALVKSCDPRKLTMAGGMLSAIATIAAAFSSSVTQLGLWFALSSVGLAFVQVSSIKPMMNYFPEDFALANGVSLAGGTIGMMVLPPVMEYLLSVYGWRSALLLMGAFNFHYIVSGAFLRPLRSDARGRYKQVLNGGDPGETQKNLVGKSKGGVKRFQDFREQLRDQFDIQLLAEPIFIVYQVVAVLSGAIFFMWHLFLVPQGIELGYGGSKAAFLATFAGLGSLVGRLSHGTLVDRGLVNGSVLFVAASLVFATSCLADPLIVSSYAALAATGVVSGLAIGVFYPLTYVIVHEVTGDHHMSAYGWLFTSLGAGEMLGGVIAGWIHDVSGNYVVVFVSIGLFTFTMAVILTITRALVYCCESGDEPQETMERRDKHS